MVHNELQKRKTEHRENTIPPSEIHTHHLRVPFVRDLYWTSLTSLILDIPVEFYWALKREGLHRRHVSHVDILGFKFELLYPYAVILGDELPMWEKYYLPVSVKGKTVLDVGAGCGETSAFYIAHGARKVVAIEPDKRAYSLLLRNIRANSLNVLPIRKPFALSDLYIPHDFLKIDAEGAEAALLDYRGSLADCVIEAHTIGVNRIHLGPVIAGKFGLRVACKLGRGEDIWLLSSP